MVCDGGQTDLNHAPLSALMAAVALSSFGIHGMRVSGPFGLIHLLAAFTFVMLPVAVTHARAGRIPAHRWTMIGLFAGALVITGLFTLTTGRVMHAVLFSAVGDREPVTAPKTISTPR